MVGLAMDIAVENAVGVSTGHFRGGCRGGAAVPHIMVMLWAAIDTSTARAVGTTLARAVATPWSMATRGSCHGKPPMASHPWQAAACPGNDSGCSVACRDMPWARPCMPLKSQNIVRPCRRRSSQGIPAAANKHWPATAAGAAHLFACPTSQPAPSHGLSTVSAWYSHFPRD